MLKLSTSSPNEAQPLPPSTPATGHDGFEDVLCPDVIGDRSDRHPDQEPAPDAGHAELWIEQRHGADGDDRDEVPEGGPPEEAVVGGADQHAVVGERDRAGY